MHGVGWTVKLPCRDRAIFTPKRFRFCRTQLTNINLHITDLIDKTSGTKDSEERSVAEEERYTEKPR